MGRKNRRRTPLAVTGGAPAAPGATEPAASDDDGDDTEASTEPFEGPSVDAAAALAEIDLDVAEAAAAPLAGHDGTLHTPGPGATFDHPHTFP